MFSIHIGCFLPYTDFSPDDWGPEFPLSTSSRYTIPMPTLYSTEGYKCKKASIIELVLYNLAALLGGVAAGYDLRVSNVSPLHPTLQPHRAELEAEAVYEGYGFAHNTYHGPARHLRAPLNALTGAALTSLQTEEQKPLRFTDSPQYAHASPSSYAPSNQAASTSGRGTALSSQASPRLADLYLDYRDHFQPLDRPDLFYRDYDDFATDSTGESHTEEFSPSHYRAPRPARLGLEPPRLRSSLKKHRRAASPSPPAAPAPPAAASPADSHSHSHSHSLSEDSSYASARDASGSARVRFSPDARRS